MCALREEGASVEKHTLIVTEKPDAAKRIAKALDSQGKPEKIEDNGVPYYIARRDRKIVVVPALGHLYTVVHERGKRNYYPVFNFKWAPRHVAERGAKEIPQWIKSFSELATNAERFVDACDYDLEGSLIGYSILKYACKGKENIAERMKYSTLTKADLERAYDAPLPHLDFALIEAGKTRHEVDWLYGINLSRALTLAAKRWSGKYATLSTGRVQGPTLKFLISRERAIRCYVPTPYWNIKAEVEINGSAYEVEYEKKEIGRRVEAEAVVEGCKGRIGKVKKVGEREYQQNPPTPFDLSGLQTQAYSLFGYTPRRTSGIAERLYLQALISYPRTSSQKLPPAIDYKAILKGLRRERAYQSLASELLEKKELKPREGKKTDSAHPAIYPTGNVPEEKLSDPERKLWDLVVRRFMAVFGEKAIRQSVSVYIDVGDHGFYLRGRQIIEEGWMRFYEPYIRTEEVLLPPIKEGDSIKLKRVIREDKFTSPPPRYNPSSLLKKMEKAGIGTKATRADIIQTLYNRGYVTDERIVVTDLGFDVIDVLQNYSPGVISAKFTHDLEEKMARIQSNNEKRENVLLEAVDQLKPQLESFREKEGTIGEELSKAIQRARLQERIVGNCPICGTGELMILFSRKTRKRFIGCTNYFKGLCETSFPLPQRGSVKPLRKECKACGWPLVLIYMRGKRPWMLCFNPDCPRKEERRRRNEMQDLRQRSN
jgi:DNA topoisomerase-1